MVPSTTPTNKNEKSRRKLGLWPNIWSQSAKKQFTKVGKFSEKISGDTNDAYVIFNPTCIQQPEAIFVALQQSDPVRKSNQLQAHDVCQLADRRRPGLFCGIKTHFLSSYVSHRLFFRRTLRGTIEEKIDSPSHLVPIPFRVGQVHVRNHARFVLRTRKHWW